MRGAARKMQPTVVNNAPPAEFGRPVESIMCCDDFKSNFARRLSNRYTSRSPTKPHKQDSTFKLHKQNIPENASERIEPSPQLSTSIDEQGTGGVEDSVKRAAAPTPGKQSPMLRRGRSDTRVHALNMEVETLRWQLSQTEANRQMHITLLKQVVRFLNRVKEHIECRKDEATPRKETTESVKDEAISIPKPSELPRSRSVLHVNRHVDYSMSPAKRPTTRMFSKSISNVNGCKDTTYWNNSRLLFETEMDTKKKITEEMTRLITLANTVLSTKLPDLACTCADITTLNTPRDNNNDEHGNIFMENNTCDTDDTYNKHDFEDNKNDTNDFILSSRVPTSLDNNFYDIKMVDSKTTSNSIDTSSKTQKAVEKRNEFPHSNFIEDESGFSSMSSFQEIGIPIISIIPASPCQEVEVEYLAEDGELQEEPDPHHSLHLEKSVQVFWV